MNSTALATVRPVRLAVAPDAEDVSTVPTPDTEDIRTVAPTVTPDTEDVPADVSPDTRDVPHDTEDVPQDVTPDTGDVPPDAEDVPPTVSSVRASADGRIKTSMSVVATNGRAVRDNTEDVRETLAALPTQAAAIRYACERVRPCTNANVRDWLTAHGVNTDASYVRRIVAPYRREHGLMDTDTLPVMTPDVLAELAPTLAPVDADDDAGIDAAIDADESGAEPADPDTEALRAQLASARGRLPLQGDPALLDVLSPEEMQAERELAEWTRATDREIRRRAKAAELSRAKREQATEDEIARTDGKDARWHRRALAARRRMSSPDARLAQLYQRAEWSSRALVAVVVLGMIWSGVNVQRNLVPSGDMADPLYWLSYGIEAMISVPIITIMVVATTAARWGRELPRGGVVLAELGLLSVTVALNAGPHIAAQHWGKAGEFAIAPIMVGVVIWLHSWVSGSYAKLITGAEETQNSTTTA
jgi:hypothetical protein